MEVAEDDLLQFRPPSLTVDVALLTLLADALHVLVLQRTEPPFAGAAVLPGGFVRLEETLDDAAARVLRQKVGLTDLFVEQLFTFGDLDRDPRGRVVTVAHYALVAARIDVPWPALQGGDVVLRADDGAPLPVGFDHARIVGTTVQRLRGKIDYAPVGFELLPEQFTLLELQQVHEAVLARPLNKDSFRRRMLASGLLQATGRRRRAVGHRPPELFRFRAAAGPTPAPRPTEDPSARD